MKKLLLVAALFVAAISNKSIASSADLFAYDDNQVTVELAQVTTIENYVTTHEDVTLTILQSDATIVNQLDLAKFNSSTASFTFDDMNWKAFAWGFCCFPIGGAIGIFTVLLKDDSTREDKISYFIGLGVGFILSSSFGGYYLR